MSQEYSTQEQQVAAKLPVHTLTLLRDAALARRRQWDAVANDPNFRETHGGALFSDLLTTAPSEAARMSRLYTDAIAVARYALAEANAHRQKG